MSKDGRDSATLILMKISHFDRTALYGLKLLELKAVAWSVILLDMIECNYVYISDRCRLQTKAAWSVTLLDSKSVSIYVLILFI